MNKSLLFRALAAVALARRTSIAQPVKTNAK